MDTVRIPDKKNTLLIAHRGASGLERENTLPAFVAAANRSYFGIECDVHVTADRQYIIYHDDRTGRLCSQDLVPEESTYARLRALRIRGSGTDTFTDSLMIPTLAEYLDVCVRYGKIAVVELKTPMPAEDIRRIAAYCREKASPQKVIFISFCFENLTALRSYFPDQTVQYLCEIYSPQLHAQLREHHMDLDIFHQALDEKRVRALHDDGIRINCWTCDSPDRARELIGWGVDFITTNILE